jgi:hypothetical protein
LFDVAKIGVKASVVVVHTVSSVVVTVANFLCLLIATTRVLQNVVP